MPCITLVGASLSEPHIDGTCVCDLFIWYVHHMTVMSLYVSYSGAHFISEASISIGSKVSGNTLPAEDSIYAQSMCKYSLV